MHLSPSNSARPHTPASGVSPSSPGAGNLAPHNSSLRGHSYSAVTALCHRRSRLLQIIFRARVWWLIQKIGWRLAWREVVRWRR